MRYAVLTLAAVLMTTLGWGGEQSRLGFKDIYLGMPGDSLRPTLEASCQREISEEFSRWGKEYRASGSFRKRSPAEQLALCLGEPSIQLRGDYEKVGSINVWTSVFLTDNVVGAIQILFGRRDYDAMRAAFVEKYGPPADQGHRVFKNKLGAQFRGEFLTWNREDGYLRLSEISDSLNVSSAYLCTKAHEEAVEKEKRSRAKRNAGGL